MKMRPRLEWLTDREKVVLIHLMDGYTCSQIAEMDYVTKATVRSQIRSILAKLGVSSQLAAVAMAYRSCWPTEEERRAALQHILEKAA